MADVKKVLAANRAAVVDLVAAAERSAATWTTPRAPGKWSPVKLASRRAILFGDAGRLDAAFDCLDQAIAERDPSLVYPSVAPHWDSLRGDARFSQRLERLALPARAEGRRH